MSLLRLIAALALLSVGLSAHPMGNFSINHYSRLGLQANSVQLNYILDFAEIPTLELAQQWGANTSDIATMRQKAAQFAPEWIRNVAISINGRPGEPRLEAVNTTITDGAGGMQVMRVEMKANVRTQPGSLVFEDRNYADRTGWKEIVIAKFPMVDIENATQSDRDLSHGLTIYPAELTVTPPQDLRASVEWSARPSISPARPAPVPPVASPIAPIKAPATFATQQPVVAGTVNRNDFLSRMLREKHFDFTTILIGVLVAFALGAMHALSPGHGKTIVAAYLVGSRSSWKHAVLLGLVVTFTHTVSVFLLGLGVLFFQNYIVPDRVIPVLGAISGLSIVAIGAWLLYKRSKALLDPHHQHNHDHHHHHHHHDHEHAHPHTHTHDGHTHSHTIPAGRLTLGGLIALGASGGLVPCPSALILLLSAIALGHPGVGLTLLVGFSSGLALILMGIGSMVLYAKHLLPKGHSAGQHSIMRLVPVFSSVVVIVLGLLMTLTAVNVIQPVKLFS